MTKKTLLTPLLLAACTSAAYSATVITGDATALSPLQLDVGNGIIATLTLVDVDPSNSNYHAPGASNAPYSDLTTGHIQLNTGDFIEVAFVDADDNPVAFSGTISFFDIDTSSSNSNSNDQVQIQSLDGLTTFSTLDSLGLEIDNTGSDFFAGIQTTSLDGSTFRIASTGTFGSVALDIATFGNQVTPIPEPSSFALLGLGALGCIMRRRR